MKCVWKKGQANTYLVKNYIPRKVKIYLNPPITTEEKSPESKYDKDKVKKIINPLAYDDNLFIPIFNDNNDPFLFESNINLKDNPFLSNIEKNSHFTMKVEAEKKRTLI